MNNLLKHLIIYKTQSEERIYRVIYILPVNKLKYSKSQ